MPENQEKSVVVSASPSESDLFTRTVRTVAILVAVCVVFVGALSAAAVAIASKAAPPRDTPAAARELKQTSPAAPTTPDPSRPRAAGTPI